MIQSQSPSRIRRRKNPERNEREGERGDLGRLFGAFHSLGLEEAQHLVL